MIARMFRAALLALVLGVSAGCSVAPVAELKMPSTLNDAGKEAQKVIVEANVALTAAYNVVAANVADGTMSPVDARAYLVQLDDYAQKVDAAQAMLDSGDIADANVQAALLNNLVTVLHKQIVAHARGK